ncbi:hypothetical protein QKU48_gp1375 [Fadolivirus algeromassiliense]|jgi:hypothetical protein|uniref:Uncharacterized protein n=1 Tax=Fadolivirus FV1/VV64 TaxID=3070911 RepID=A0A7D3URP0_9VIRU|nr:hypothetical protein QKU48_gp1375 [Fadolivirus algeromassiliense]QKF94833.1 hypothetical protein Fadolivirus_1_1375 [Fadolivirus FV1/VV64]
MSVVINTKPIKTLYGTDKELFEKCSQIHNIKLHLSPGEIGLLTNFTKQMGISDKPPNGCLWYSYNCQWSMYKPYNYNSIYYKKDFDYAKNKSCCYLYQLLIGTNTKIIKLKSQQDEYNFIKDTYENKPFAVCYDETRKEVPFDYLQKELQYPDKSKYPNGRKFNILINWDVVRKKYDGIDYTVRRESNPMDLTYNIISCWIPSFDVNGGAVWNNNNNGLQLIFAKENSIWYQVNDIVMDGVMNQSLLNTHNKLDKNIPFIPNHNKIQLTAIPKYNSKIMSTHTYNKIKHLLSYDRIFVIRDNGCLRALGDNLNIGYFISYNLNYSDYLCVVDDNDIFFAVKNISKGWNDINRLLRNDNKIILKYIGCTNDEYYISEFNTNELIKYDQRTTLTPISWGSVASSESKNIPENKNINIPVSWSSIALSKLTPISKNESVNISGDKINKLCEYEYIYKTDKKSIYNEMTSDDFSFWIEGNISENGKFEIYHSDNLILIGCTESISIPDLINVNKKEFCGQNGGADNIYYSKYMKYKSKYLKIRYKKYKVSHTSS